MKTGLKYTMFCLLITASAVTACKKHYEVIESGEEVFNFIVTDAQREFINASRGLQYEVTEPIPVLHYAGDVFTIDRFEVRGDNTLNFTRKGFSVNMDRKITVYSAEEEAFKEIEEFKLLAMVYDYTYIENSIATGLHKEIGLWPVCSFFTELSLCGHTQGLYFFIEDPFEYFIEKENASFVLRRGYDHVKKAYSISPGAQHTTEYYSDRFKRLYSSLPLYSGQQMYDTLSVYIDLEQYFTKLSIDLLLKNGDYTDEVIFYTKIKNNNEIFGVFPWDLDDIFASQPHEIGRDWATGTVFGTRVYNSMEDIIADVGSILLFSIEDDLDYKIAKDSVLYQEYLKTLRIVMEKIDLATIDSIFDDTYEKIGAFYKNDAIVDQSKNDVDETNYDLFITNLASKRQMMKERREWILQELNIQQSKNL